MKVLPLVRIPVVLSLLAPYTLTFSQGVRQLFEGSPSLRQTLEVKDLPEDFKAVRIQAGAPADTMSMLAQFSFGMGANPLAMIYRLGDVSWTDGSTVQLDNGPFLVTYKLDISPSMISAMQPNSMESPATPATPPTLKLVLVRVSSVSSLSMEPSITKKSLLESLQPLATANAGAMTATAAAPVEGARRAGTQTEALNNIKQVALGAMMYVSDYDDVYPWVQSTRGIREVTRPYLRNDNVWETLNPKGGQILFNMALGGVREQDIPNPAETVLYYDSAAWPDGRRTVAFTDGHAKLVKPAEWDVFKKTLTLKLKKTAKKPLPSGLGLAIPR